MPTDIVKREPEPVGIVADRALYTANDGSVVEEGDPKAAFLLAAMGSFIQPADVKRLGLSVKGGKVTQDKDAEGAQLPVAEVNEGKIRAPGEPLRLAPRTGILRPEMAPRDLPEPGTELDPKAGPQKTVVVSNVPPEDDEFRKKVAEETDDPEAGEKAREEAAERAAAPAKSAARTPTARKAARKR